MQVTPPPPEHIAIIMDGNGRWAQNRFMPRTAGHAKGAANVKRLVEHCARMGVKCLTLFAFSTENWGRPTDEVGALMRLFVQYLEKDMSGLAAAGVKLKVIGDVGGFNEDLQQQIRVAEDATADNKNIVLCVAANYGGRWDVLNAVKAWQRQHPESPLDDLSEKILANYLSTAEMSDVDLLIRTGGERRISNFLLWQSAYAEIWFSDVLWPDFSVNDLDKAIEWFANRQRRFGMTSTQIASIN